MYQLFVVMSSANLFCTLCYILPNFQTSLVTATAPSIQQETKIPLSQSSLVDGSENNPAYERHPIFRPMRLVAPHNLVFHLHLHPNLHLHGLLPGWSCQRSAPAWLILPTCCCLVDPANGLLPGWSCHNLRANERPWIKKSHRKGQQITNDNGRTSQLLDWIDPVGCLIVCLTGHGTNRQTDRNIVIHSKIWTQWKQII